MRNVYTLLFLLMGAAVAFAQQKPFTPTKGVDAQVLRFSHRGINGPDTASFDPSLKPFYHGVASGDPLEDAVVIWTRVTPESSHDTTINVYWHMATDTGMQNVVAFGTKSTNQDFDYTIKIDVDDLAPNTTYYYEFETGGVRSIRGRTRTASTGATENHLRFAVVSCSNYEAGYFNAYARIADRNDLAAVIHLGDYIYEYPTNVYGDTSLIDRRHGDFETVSTGEYRSRYSLYRLDPDLRRAHQQHPFINVWDDHETANDAWNGGAENHTDSTEGEWNIRKRMARKAYYEWIPIRENEFDSAIIYRSFEYGDLLDVIMLDTRIVGRDSQINDVLAPALYDPNRTILGETQRSWLLDKLDNSNAKWHIIGNQVIFSQLYVGWSALGDTTQTPAEVESAVLDIWDGYPIERLNLINYLRDNDIDNTVFVTGDFHSTFAFDVADTVLSEDPLSLYGEVENYDPVTGDGSVAVEFATPSISAANFDENFGALLSAGFEFQINQPIGALPYDNNPNPHMKNVDLDQHGYTIVDVRDDSVQANWYYVDRLDEVSAVEEFGAAYYTKDGNNHLTRGQESPIKAQQEIPAPASPRFIPTRIEGVQSFAVMGIYPNPAQDYFVMQYALEKSEWVQMNLVDLQGRVVSTLVNELQISGVYEMDVDVSQLAAGIYLLQGQVGKQRLDYKVIVK
ncbi:MAG: alkaline phosphatase D family protein [Bacteroidota bacterium]